MSQKAPEVIKLTPEQVRFAEENHNIIYTWLIDRRHSEEYYGIGAEGYLKAVKTFNKDKSAFGTWAYKLMDQAYLIHLRQYNKLRKLKEPDEENNTWKYMMQTASIHRGVLSDDEDSKLTFEQLLIGQYNIDDDVLEQDRWLRRIAYLSIEQLKIVLHSYRGLSMQQIGDMLGLAPRTVGAYRGRIKRQILEDDETYMVSAWKRTRMQKEAQLPEYRKLLTEVAKIIRDITETTTSQLSIDKYVDDTISTHLSYMDEESDSLLEVQTG